jgi:two-component system CheB/CheR fusion protein
MDGLVITFVDIDRIKQAQERETQARRHTQIMVDALPQALFVIDYDLIIVSANRAFYEMFRSTPGAEIGEKLDKVGEGRWNTRELLQCVHQVILEGVSVRTVQVELQGLSGLRTASVTVRPLAAQPDAERHLLLIEVEPPTSS